MLSLDKVFLQSLMFKSWVNLAFDDTFPTIKKGVFSSRKKSMEHSNAKVTLRVLLQFF